jgi:hypothetical protein
MAGTVEAKHGHSRRTVSAEATGSEFGGGRRRTAPGGLAARALGRLPASQIGLGALGCAPRIVRFPDATERRARQRRFRFLSTASFNRACDADEPDGSPATNYGVELHVGNSGRSLSIVGDRR